MRTYKSTQVMTNQLHAPYCPNTTKSSLLLAVENAVCCFYRISSVACVIEGLAKQGKTHHTDGRIAFLMRHTFINDLLLGIASCIGKATRALPDALMHPATPCKAAHHKSKSWRVPSHPNIAQLPIAPEDFIQLCGSCLRIQVACRQAPAEHSYWHACIRM